MGLLLLLDTATRVCSVALSLRGEVIGIRETDESNSHSQVITPFIEAVMAESGHALKDLDAVAVSKGPGSYTGLRIGVSTAKGLCYALDKPLLAVETLASMAAGMRQATGGAKGLYIPMIDARRMEVYNAVYGEGLNNLRETQAEIITAESFADYASHTVYLAGDGAAKCMDVLPHSNFILLEDNVNSARFMAQFAEDTFNAGQFENVAYFEPYYLKDFVAGLPKVKGLR